MTTTQLNKHERDQLTKLLRKGEHAMVVRWKNKDGTGGVLMRPYTPEERTWLKHRGTVDHGGPYIRWAREAFAPAASSSRHTQGDEPIGKDGGGY